MRVCVVALPRLKQELTQLAQSAEGNPCRVHSLMKRSDNFCGDCSDDDSAGYIHARYKIQQANIPAPFKVSDDNDNR